MVSERFVAELLLILLWLYVILAWAWPFTHLLRGRLAPPPTSARRQRSGTSTPFPGLTVKPPCAACKQAVPSPMAPPAPPPPIISGRGCPRQVDASIQFCPHTHCAYYGRRGYGNLQANGHPNGGPWRQWHCTVCEGYFLETHGTPLYGTRVAVDRLVWAVGALAEGLGIRAVARVFEVDPHTVLRWLVDAVLCQEGWPLRQQDWPFGLLKTQIGPKRRAKGLAGEGGRRGEEDAMTPSLFSA